MKLIFSPLAEKQLRKLQKVTQILIANKVRQLREGNLADTKSIKGYKNFFRTRMGKYRIVFKLSPDNIYIVVLGHRKEVYKVLDRILR